MGYGQSRTSWFILDWKTLIRVTAYPPGRYGLVGEPHRGKGLSASFTFGGHTTFSIRGGGGLSQGFKSMLQTATALDL